MILYDLFMIITFPTSQRTARAFINPKHKQTVALLGANMRGGGDIARSQEIVPDLDSPTVRRNVGNVLPADAISRRSSTIILGQEIHTDDYIDRRVKWAQRGIGASALLAVLCYITGEIVNSYFLRLLAIAFGVLVNIFIGILYCNNFSFVIVKRLSKEPNVIIIAALTVFNLIVDIATSHNLLGPVFASIYFLTINAYVFFRRINLEESKFYDLYWCSVCYLKCLQHIR